MLRNVGRHVLWSLLGSGLVSCSASLVGPAAIVRFSAQADFGTVAAGSSVRRLIALSNQGSSLWGISSSHLKSPYAFTGGAFPGTEGTCADLVDSGSSCILDVTYSPLASGAYSGPIGLTYQDASGSITAAASVTANATGGNLDLSFGTAGVVVDAISVSAGPGNIFPLSDGNLTTVGWVSDGTNTHLYGARYDASGKRDPSFGTLGVTKVSISATTDYNAGGGALQPDGKVVIGGYSSFGTADYTMARLASDGSLDPGFGTAGIVHTVLAGRSVHTNSVLLQSDGKLLLVGYSSSGSDARADVLRYQPDGTADSGFGTAGLAFATVGTGETTAQYAQLDASERILVTAYVMNGAAHAIGLFRFLQDGSLDASFGTGGAVLTTLASGDAYPLMVQVQTDGKIVVVGSFNDGIRNRFLVARYFDTGTLDDSFGAGGLVVTSIDGNDNPALVHVIQPDGKIVVGGHYQNGTDCDVALARYNTDGSLDTSFGNGGQTHVGSAPGINDYFDYVALQPDGKIVVVARSVIGGNQTPSIFRFWP